MKTMSDYTNYCTQEQTERAIKLGCPCESPEDYTPIKLPTTQQMLNWLREKGFNAMVDFKNEDEEPYEYTYRYLVYYKNHSFYGDECKSYRQAELAAIDAALDYLEKGE